MHVLRGVEGHGGSGRPCEVSGPEAAGEDDVLTGDRAAVRPHPRDTPRVAFDLQHGGALVHADARSVGSLGQSEHCHAGVEVSVTRLVQRSHHTFGLCDRPQLLDRTGTDLLDVDPVVARDAGAVAQLVPATRRGRERE